MKKIVAISIIFIAFSLSSLSQETNPKGTLFLGLNGSFYGSGDVLGLGLTTDFTIPISKFFAVSPRIMIGASSAVDRFNYSHLSSLALSSSLSITPFPDFFDNIKVEIGGLYHRLIKSHGDVYTKTQYGSYLSDNSEYSKDNLWGLIGSIKINIFDNNSIIWGLRADMLTSFTSGYYNCDSIQTGIYFGKKF